ncbi:MAG: hypothetical protein CME90_19635 [Hoeflea sp.]|nr:hypothetical protein [Hoeflea sp.]
MEANGFGHRRIVSTEPVTQPVVAFLREAAKAAEIVGLRLSCAYEVDNLAATESRSVRRLA